MQQSYLLSVQAIVVHAQAEMLVQESIVIIGQSRHDIVAVHHSKVSGHPSAQVSFHELP